MEKKKKENNKVINVFIKILLIFQIIISVFVQIDRFLYDSEYATTFVIEDFISDKYFSTKNIFWEILRGGYDFTFFWGFIIRSFAIGLDIATEESSLILYNFIELLIVCVFLYLLQKILNLILSKLKNRKRE